MRTVPLPMLHEMMFGSPAAVDLVELYITSAIVPDIRLAMYDQNVAFNGSVYLPAGFRTPIKTRQSLSESLSEVQLILPDVDREIAALIQATDLAGSPVIIRRVLLSRLASGQSMEFYRGKIKAPVSMEGTTVILTIIPRTDDPDEMARVPRRAYGHSCGFRFGGPECGVDKTLYRYDGEAGAGSNAVSILDGGLTQGVIDALSTSYRVNANTGENLMSALPSVVIGLSGFNEGVVRPVAAITPCRIELRKPFYVNFEDGDEYRLERRCPKTLDACEGFGNLGLNTPQRNGSFAHSPKEPRSLLRELLR